MKVWSNVSNRCRAASRAIMSVLPPAANGTMTGTGRTGPAAAGPKSERAAPITAGAIVMINVRFGRTPLWLSERADGPEHKRQGQRQQHERGNDDNCGGNADPITNKTIDHR